MTIYSRSKKLLLWGNNHPSNMQTLRMVWPQSIAKKWKTRLWVTVSIKLSVCFHMFQCFYAQHFFRVVSINRELQATHVYFVTIGKTSFEKSKLWKLEIQSLMCCCWEGIQTSSLFFAYKPDTKTKSEKFHSTSKSSKNLTILFYDGGI